MISRRARVRDSTEDDLSNIPSNCQENCGYSLANTTAKPAASKGKFDVPKLVPCFNNISFNVISDQDL